MAETVQLYTVTPIAGEFVAGMLHDGAGSTIRLTDAQARYELLLGSIVPDGTPIVVEPPAGPINALDRLGLTRGTKAWDASVGELLAFLLTSILPEVSETLGDVEGRIIGDAAAADNTLGKLATRIATLAEQTKSGFEGLAPLRSPAFRDQPTAPTPLPGTNSDRIATTAFVVAALAALVNSSPAALDTLDELAAALGDDPNFAATITTALGNRLRVDVAQGLTPGQIAQALNNLGVSVFIRDMLDDADAAAARLTLGLGSAALAVSGDFQPASSKLSALAALAWTADKLIYATGAGAVATADLTVFARTLLDDADGATMRGTLGLGTAATAAATAFAAAVHPHAVADVSGLQGALDGKASNVTGLFSTRVGVNVVSPVTRLHVAGDAAAPATMPFGDFQGNGQLFITGATSTTKRLALGVDTASAAMVAVIQAVESSVATRPLLLNPSGGPVGVNTTNPLTALDVAGIIRPGSYTVATVPAGVVGGLIFATNARKVGEASGAGTGVIAYFSNGSWRRFSDDTAIAA